jgi:hypothetical protein
MGILAILTGTFSIGPPSQQAADAHKTLFDATEAGAGHVAARHHGC